MKLIVTILLAVACTGAAARCTANDAWRGPDKTKHVLVGAALGASGALVFRDPHVGFWLGAAVGLAKEVRDARGSGTCSLQDFAVTALGAAAGAYGTAWIVTPTRGGAFVGFTARL